MKDILLVLFYQAIVAVNTAVILSGIIWLAKREEEKDERKPKPDFAPPPEKKPPKPPTTGTNVIEPKPHGYHLSMTTYDAKDYGETHTFNGEEYERTMVAQSADGSVVSMNYIRKHPQPKPYPHDIEELKASLDEWKCEPPMHIPTEGAKEHKRDKYSCLYSPFCNLTSEQVLNDLDRYIKDIRPNDLLDRVENEIRKRIKDDERTGTQPIQSFIGEVRGGPGNEVMGTVTAKSAEELGEKLKALSDRLDRVEKKPVTTERLKEAGVEVEPVNVFNPAEESVKRYETDFINEKCGDCYYFANTWRGSYCALRNEPENSHERRRCHFFKRYEVPVQTTHICKNCKHYLATEEGAATGLCGMMEEIVFGNNYHACFEKREEKDHE